MLAIPLCLSAICVRDAFPAVALKLFGYRSVVRCADTLVVIAGETSTERRVPEQPRPLENHGLAAEEEVSHIVELGGHVVFNIHSNPLVQPLKLSRCEFRLRQKLRYRTLLAVDEVPIAPVYARFDLPVARFLSSAVDVVQLSIDAVHPLVVGGTSPLYV